MVVAVSGLEVALVSAIAAVAAVVMTPLAAFITARQQHRHERWLHLYTDRRDAYVALLQYNERNASWLESLVKAFEEDSNANLEEPLNPDPDEYATIVARVGAFASDELLEESEKFQEGLVEAIALVGKWNANEITREDAIPLLRNGQHQAQPHLATLRGAIRNELAGKPKDG